MSLPCCYCVLGFGRGDDGHVLVRHLLRRDLDLVVVLVGVEREYLEPCAVVTDEAPTVDAGVVAQPEHDGIVSVQCSFVQGFHALREGLIRPKVPKQLILGLSAFAESRTLFLGALVDLDAFVEHPGAVTHHRLGLVWSFAVAVAGGFDLDAVATDEQFGIVAGFPCVGEVERGG